MSNNKTVTENIDTLEDLLNWFESEEITVEEAIKKYEKAVELSRVLDRQLKEAKNKIQIIKQS